MSKDVNRIAALRFNRAINGASIIDWAMTSIENGVETPSLILLAGLSRSMPNDIEVDDYFVRSLVELGYKDPSPDTFSVSVS